MAFEAEGQESALWADGKAVRYPNGRMQRVIASVFDVLSPMLPLDDLSDSFVPGMFSKTEKFCRGLDDTVKNFEQVDEDLAGSMVVRSK